MDGFEVKCLKCDETSTLTSKADNYMGFNGSDIFSSNDKIYVVAGERKYASIKCKCGNVIVDC